MAARIRTAVRRRGAKLLIFHTRKSDLDKYADISANVVSLERSFWKQVATSLQDAQRPVLVYGPNAMTSIGVTVMERLIKIFEAKTGRPMPTATGRAVAGQHQRRAHWWPRESKRWKILACGSAPSR